MTATPEHRARYKQGIRDWYNDYKHDAKCANCGLPGSIYPDKLQFHHVNGAADKDDNVAHLVQQARSLRTIKAEIAKCVVLCEDCHAKEHGMATPDELRKSRLLKGADADA